MTTAQILRHVPLISARIYGMLCDVNPEIPATVRWHFSQRTLEIRAAYSRHCTAVASKHAAMRAMREAGF